MRLDSVVSVISGNIERLSCSYRWQGEARELGVEIDGATWRMPALAGDSDEIWAQLFGLCHALAASDRTCHVTQLSRQSASFLVDAKPQTGKSDLADSDSESEPAARTRPPNRDGRRRSDSESLAAALPLWPLAVPCNRPPACQRRLGLGHPAGTPARTKCEGPLCPTAG